MTRKSRIDTEIVDLVQLMSRQAVEEQYGEAVASLVSADKIVSWAKFILTDDRPNVNKQRIPVEEFDNIIKSGIFMPVKMARGEIKDGHEGAEPIGVITHLRKMGSKIEALAALWSEERPEDVSYIKELVENGDPVNVSWEILYGDSKISDGVSDLLDTVLRAVTIVGMPAYAGRTPVLAVASKKWSKAYVDQLPNSSFLYVDNEGTRYFAYADEQGNLDKSRFASLIEEISNSSLPQNTLKNVIRKVRKLEAMAGIDDEEDDVDTEEQKLETKELEAKVNELTAKLALANEQLADKTEELTKVTGERDDVKETLETLEAEVEPLREFKKEADEALARQEKLDAVKAKFKDSGVEKPEEYFVENEEHLLGLDESSLEFMLQEMVAFKKADDEDDAEAEASVRNPTVPNFNGKSDPKLDDIKKLAEALRKRNKK